MIAYLSQGDNSLDSSLYRRVYNDFTVIPVGSCEQVIHTVISFATRPELHRVGCAGLVDGDGRSSAEAAHLGTKGIYCLPVSEVENLLLLPTVFLAIAKALQFSDADAQTNLSALRTFVMSEAARHIDAICLRHTKRRVDAAMKKVGLTSTDIAAVDEEFKTATANIDPPLIFAQTKTELNAAISRQNYEEVLYFYDNKGLLSEAGKLLGYQQKALEGFIGRALRSEDNPALHAALRGYLPTVTPRP